MGRMTLKWGWPLQGTNVKSFIISVRFYLNIWPQFLTVSRYSNSVTNIWTHKRSKENRWRRDEKRFLWRTDSNEFTMTNDALCSHYKLRRDSNTYLKAWLFLLSSTNPMKRQIAQYVFRTLCYTPSITQTVIKNASQTRCMCSSNNLHGKGKSWRWVKVEQVKWTSLTSGLQLLCVTHVFHYLAHLHI